MGTSVAHSSAVRRGHRSAPAPVEFDHLPPILESQLPPPSLPIGVAVLAASTAFVGLVVLLAGVLFVLNAYASLLVPSGLLILDAGNVLGSIVLVVLGSSIVGLSTALWRQELWAFYLTVAFMFGGLGYLFFTGSITFLFVLVLVVFIYLIAVRHHFY
jgi:hypothetical protein